ncbi:phosphotransferase [Microbispora sp. NPDC046973]|uniref:phosphotransferase family protein n=1 Tax=Microbispora sp. NPDC046973 TaxID=3155022 RepID=UPI0033F17C69
MSERYLAYPPGRGNVWIPARGSRSAAAGLSLLTFSKPLPLALQFALFAAVRTAGPLLLPGRRRPWSPPVAEEAWKAVGEQAADVVGPWDSLAGYVRPQASRADGAALLLLRAGRPLGFLKIRQSPAELEREAVALAALAAEDQVLFRVPRVLGSGAAQGLHWLLLSPMEPVPARPARNVDIARLTERISSGLEGELPRPSHTPGHWRPMHGDLTPWNLRRTRTRTPWLIDWEDAGYGPPEADEAYFLATRLAVYGGPPPTRTYGEAALYWHDVVSRRTTDDPGLAQRLLRILRELAG